MRTLLIVFITLSLAGCANDMQRDLPHPVITQEQDTPFIFKERYQTQNIEVTQAFVSHQSDFVKIQTTDEFVFWHPTTVSADGQVTPTKTIHNHNDNNTPNATDEPLVSLLDKKLPEKTNIYHTTPNLTVATTSTCKPVTCDGEICGNIAVCEGKPCDPSLHNKYACNDDTCALIVDNPTVAAKGESYCQGFEQLDNCPGNTPCNQQTSLLIGEIL